MGLPSTATARTYTAMILTLCMAGFNTRFHNAGFDVPKYLLPWENGVIVSAILDAFNAKETFSRVLLVANQRDRYFMDSLVKAVDHVGITQDDIIYVPDTRGQAHTAALAAQLILERARDAHEPIAFHNADTILVGRDWRWIAEQLATRNVFVDVFPASSNAYSYVALHEGRVSRIVEKKVISPFASSGLYAFQDAQSYLNAFEKHAEQVSDTNGEIYISNLIQTMISDGADVFINELNHDASTTVLGKPEEYGLELARRALMR